MSNLYLNMKVVSSCVVLLIVVQSTVSLPPLCHPNKIVCWGIQLLDLPDHFRCFEVIKFSGFDKVKSYRLFDCLCHIRKYECEKHYVEVVENRKPVERSLCPNPVKTKGIKIEEIDDSSIYAKIKSFIFGK